MQYSTQLTPLLYAVFNPTNTSSLNGINQYKIPISTNSIKKYPTQKNSSQPHSPSPNTIYVGITMYLTNKGKDL